MKVVALVSGGKDSCFAMMKCIDYGHEIIALANLLPDDDSVDELDSYMYQTVGHQIVVSYAECLGLPLFRRRIQGSMRHHHLSYKTTPGDEVEDLFILLNEVKRHIPSVTAVSSGAIASDYQRLRVESVCSRLGLVSLAYLWKQDQTFLLEEMINRGIVAVVVKVAAMGLNPQKHLGRELVDLKGHLLQMKELYGINVCGEGGEYETLTLDCPLFKNARIVLDKSEVVLHSPDSIAPVGVLRPLAFHLVQKLDSVSCKSMENDDFTPEEVNRVFEVKGDLLANYLEKCENMDATYGFGALEQIKMCASPCTRETFSIGCWVHHSSSSDGMQKDLTAVLHTIDLQLKKDCVDWANVLYIHLYISDMKQFVSANEVYLRFITERKCYLGVPSRCTIEVPIAEVGLGNAYVEVLVSKDIYKRVLHVQSMSCWAPSCIGPYSQATLHKELLYMAGQLGLDPPTMLLLPDGPAAEMDQALLNCEAVANCFRCSVSSSAVIITVYCSSVSFSELDEIQNRMNDFLKRTVPNEGFQGTLSPVLLYVLVPNLPKGAHVEVKPVLHCPEDEGHAFQPADNGKYVEWLNTFCKINVVPEKICTALISVTKEHAVSICSEHDENLKTDFSGTSRKHMKAVALFFVDLIEKIISGNGFHRQHLKSIRFYVLKDLVTAADLHFSAFSEAFAEHAASNNEVDATDKTIFNLVPVLGSGMSSSMDGLITCELFASKL